MPEKNPVPSVSPCAGEGPFIFNRSTGTVEKETVMGNGALRFAYETALGRAFWPMLFGTSFVSALLGRFYDSRFSRKAIASLAELPGCHPEEAEKDIAGYTSFNDFFTRRLKAGSRKADPAKDVLVSPADGRLQIFPDCPADGPVPVKGARRTLNELCLGKLENDRFAVAVIRLAPVDYHRYHFPCDCVFRESPEIVRGKYHSVNPLALRKSPDLYVGNTRQISLLDSPVFGIVRMIEVGAFGVGSIVQTASPGPQNKMNEKGYFKFGGSTVILILPSGCFRFDGDLLAAKERGLEVLVRCGMRIGARS